MEGELRPPAGSGETDLAEEHEGPMPLAGAREWSAKRLESSSSATKESRRDHSSTEETEEPSSMVPRDWDTGEGIAELALRREPAILRLVKSRMGRCRWTLGTSLGRGQSRGSASGRCRPLLNGPQNGHFNDEF